MLAEEAGQILEVGSQMTMQTSCHRVFVWLTYLQAHILGSLVPSVEHLILIGDPLQLRPTLNNYCA
jgi:hypothetical protein